MIEEVMNNNDNEILTNNISPYILDDRIFVRVNDKMIKIIIGDIYYIEANRNYSKIFTKSRAYMVVTTLKNLISKLPKAHFLRIHRSYIVNTSHVDEVAGTNVVICKKAIPLSKKLRSLLLERLQMI